MADAEERGKEGESKEGGEEVRWSEGGKRERGGLYRGGKVV